jgi:hypothetical protein
MMNDKDLEEMQRGLAKLLGLTKYKKYPDGAMRIVLKVYRQDVESVHGTGALEDLRQPALGIYHAWEAGGPRGSSPQGGQISETAAEELGDYATERSKLFSEHLAKLAAPEEPIIRQPGDGKPVKVYSEVKGFRVKYLDDKLLSPEQARTLLDSPVAARWSHLAFRTLRLPVIGHTYHATDGMSDETGAYSLVEVPLPSSKVESFKDRRPLRAGAWELPNERADARSNERPMRELKPWKIVPYPGEDGFTHRVLVEKQSVLGVLYDIVGRLVQRYPWDETDGVWFVLTGQTPHVAPLTWQARWFSVGIPEDSFTYGFVTLKIEPWVDPKLVWKVYTEIQRGLRKGRRNRQLGDKSLELLRFVNEQANVSTLTRSERRKVAPELVAAWDKGHPNDSFEGDTREFWKAYHRARQAVMSPTYEWHDEK